MLNTLLRKFTSSDLTLKETFTAPNFAKALKILPSSARSQIITKSKTRHLESLPKLKQSHKVLAKNQASAKKLPKISAKSWIVFNIDNQSVISGHNTKLKREVASLSKIMTCVVTLDELKHRKCNLEDQVIISFKAAAIEGTSAGLLFKDCLRVIDLLFALMLPSGNDAAVALAEHLGAKMIGNGSALEKFVRRMNEIAKSLQMDSSFFENPHGMSTSINLSTAEEIARLTCFAMKSEIFKSIVSCKQYNCLIQSEKGVRKVVWINTNRLLKRGFNGVKTGSTPAAGACLSCSIKNLVIVVLGCKYKHERWKDAILLYNWARESENY